MRCIQSNENKNQFLFFFDSLVDTFKPTDEHLWAFSAYFGRGLDGLGAWASSPIYPNSELALRAAKLHALTSFVERSREIHCLTFHPTDRVFTQAENSTERFGSVLNMNAIDFYPVKQDRLDILRDIRLCGKSDVKSVGFTDLDGNRFEGRNSCRVIQIDPNTALLLEHLELTTQAC